MYLLTNIPGYLHNVNPNFYQYIAITQINSTKCPVIINDKVDLVCVKQLYHFFN